MRSNLDPFARHSDDECWEALKRSHLAKMVQARPQHCISSTLLCEASHLRSGSTCEICCHVRYPASQICAVTRQALAQAPVFQPAVADCLRGYVSPTNKTRDNAPGAFTLRMPWAKPWGVCLHSAPWEGSFAQCGSYCSNMQYFALPCHSHSLSPFAHYRRAGSQQNTPVALGYRSRHRAKPPHQSRVLL